MSSAGLAVGDRGSRWRLSMQTQRQQGPAVGLGVHRMRLARRQVNEVACFKAQVPVAQPDDQAALQAEQGDLAGRGVLG